MLNDKWVKLFVTTETQTVLTIVFENGRWQVEASVMINGDMYSVDAFQGEEGIDDLEAAKKAFDNFSRLDASAFVAQHYFQVEVIEDAKSKTTEK